MNSNFLKNSAWAMVKLFDEDEMAKERHLAEAHHPLHAVPVQKAGPSHQIDLRLEIEWMTT
ncbi:MAG: hypothetical protein ABSA83_11130 [Verrucomicrobiota bacterium]|jgi:hypothetical protein